MKFLCCLHPRRESCVESCNFSLCVIISGSNSYSFMSCIHTFWPLLLHCCILGWLQVVVVSWLFTTCRFPRMQVLPALVASYMRAWSHVLYPEYFGSCDLDRSSLTCPSLSDSQLPSFSSWQSHGLPMRQNLCPMTYLQSSMTIPYPHGFGSFAKRMVW